MARKLVEKTYTIVAEITVTVEDVGEHMKAEGYEDELEMEMMRELQRLMLADKKCAGRVLANAALIGFQSYVEEMCLPDYTEALTELIRGLPASRVRSFFWPVVKEDCLFENTESLYGDSMVGEVRRLEFAEEEEGGTRKNLHFWLYGGGRR